MKDEIIQIISSRTPFSYERTKIVYDMLKSYDMTIKILDLASALNRHPAELAGIIIETQGGY